MASAATSPANDSQTRRTLTRTWPPTYTTLTDLEAVFRSPKSDLGLRPIQHRKPARAEGHLCIAGITYQAVQVVGGNRCG